MAKKGKLIGIGVGPGDTELLTLKAAKVLESVPVRFSPKSAKYSIIKCNTNFRKKTGV